MKTTLWVMLMALCLISKAQTLDWAPVGAKWYYEETYFGNSNIGYVSIESKKDTIINNHLCKMLLLNKATYQLVAPWNFDTIFYTYISQDTIYLYNTVANAFRVIFINNLNVGDTLKLSWEIQNYGTCNYKYSVDSIHTILMNGVSIQKLTLKELPSGNRYHYYKNIGGIDDIFTLLILKSECIGNTVIDGTLYKIRCYEHPVYGLFQFSTVSCNYTYTPSPATLNWSETGAKWYYGETYNNDSISYVMIESVRDTIIKNKNCKMLHLNKSTNGIVEPLDTNNQFYTYKSNDTIYFFNFYTQEFVPVFINNLNVGNTHNINWVSGFGNCNYQFTVDSVHYVWMNGFMLRKLTLKDIFNNNRYHYFENIGGVELLTLLDNKINYCNYPVVTEPHWVLRCYYTPYYLIKFSPENCDFTTSISQKNTPKINVYYYEHKLYFNLYEKLLPFNLKIINVLGEENINIIKNDTSTVELNDLSSGIYFVQLYFVNGEKWVKRIFVEQK